MAEVYFELSHGPDDGDHTLYGVRVDHGAVLQALVVRVTLLVNNSGTGERDMLHGEGFKL